MCRPAQGKAEASQPRPRPVTVGLGSEPASRRRAGRAGRQARGQRTPLPLLIKPPCVCPALHCTASIHHLFPSRSGPSCPRFVWDLPASAAPRPGVPDHRSVSSRNRRSRYASPRPVRHLDRTQVRAAGWIPVVVDRAVRCDATLLFVLRLGPASRQDVGRGALACLPAGSVPVAGLIFHS